MGWFIPTACIHLRRPFPGEFHCVCPARQRRWPWRLLFGAQPRCILQDRLFGRQIDCPDEKPGPRPPAPRSWR